MTGSLQRPSLRAAILRFVALAIVAATLALLFATETWTSPRRPRPAASPGVTGVTGVTTPTGGNAVPGARGASGARAREFGPPPFRLLLQNELLRWAAWALVAPFVVALVHRFPVGKGHTIRNAAILLAAAIPVTALRAFVVMCLGIVVLGHNPPSMVEGFTLIMRRGFALNSFIYLLVVAASHVVTLLREMRQRDILEAQLATQLVSARLTALEAQLHPHFFFNTLHTISALLDRDAGTARRVLTRFGDLMRMLLESSGQPRTTLDWEISFLRCYAEIQQVRFADRLEFRFDTQGHDSASVPRLILQPLVENAVRHGVEGAGGGGPVTVEVTAARTNGQLRLTVTDTGKGLQGVPLREGVGLTTTRERLHAAYGTGASLELASAGAGGVIATILLPYETEGTLIA